MSEPKTFIEFVQQHERDWGNETYQNRPNLAEILQAAVVVFWEPNNASEKDRRLIISPHDSLEDVEQFLVKLVFRSNLEPPKYRIQRIYKGGKRVRVGAVHIDFEVENE